MLNYADYTYYSSTYKGGLTDSLFNFYIGKASRLIDEVSNREITAEYLNANEIIKYVACELVDCIASNDANGNIASKSIDGVSLTYKTKSNADFNNLKAEILNKLPQDLTRYV